MALSESVGAHIKLRREQRGISMAELARRADLGKGTLSNLEAGNGNPTLDTLDALARGLGIPLTDLLTAPPTAVVTVVRGEEPVDGEVSRQFMARLSGGHSLEMWHVNLPPGRTFDGVPHAHGTIEHILLVAGTLTAGPTSQPVELEPGDLIAFPGDTPHHYAAGPNGADIHFVFAAPAAG